MTNSNMSIDMLRNITSKAAIKPSQGGSFGAATINDPVADRTDHYWHDQGKNEYRQQQLPRPRCSGHSREQCTDGGNTQRAE